MVWVWSEGKERCWFDLILVWEGMGSFFGFAGKVGFAEGEAGSGGAGDVGFAEGRKVA